VRSSRKAILADLLLRYVEAFTCRFHIRRRERHLHPRERLARWLLMTQTAWTETTAVGAGIPGHDAGGARAGAHEALQVLQEAA
jgi:hypothetical protein